MKTAFLNARAAAIAGRIAAIALVVASPFAPTWSSHDDAPTTVFVVDRSDSIAHADLALSDAMVETYENTHPGTRVGEVDVHGEARVVRWPGFEAAERPATTVGTDLGAGIRLGAAILPPSGRRRLIVLTDGRSTRPVDPALIAARAAGIRVDFVTLGQRSTGQPQLTQLETTSPRLRVGEPLRATAHLQGTAGATVTVEWSLNARPISNSVVQIGPNGTGEAVFERASPEAGIQIVRAAVRGERETARRSAVVQVSGRPRVEVITLTSRDAPPLLMRALEGAADVHVNALSDRDFALTGLQDADLVVLSDLPLATEGAPEDVLAGLDIDTQNALLRYVSEGGGLLVGGGIFGFSPEWADLPLSRALPVGIESDGEVTDPPVAMAIMLDASGSMGARVGGYTKIQLAIEGSLAAASTLRPEDQVGIGAVETRTRWIHRLSPAHTLDDNRQRLRAMRAGGGGIYTYTALSDAYRVLAGTDEPIRHVVLFADTSDAAEQFEYCSYGCEGRRSAEDLAREARDAGITTTVVGIGSGTAGHAPFLSRLAAAGGGRYYLTEEGTDLRRIFVTETRAVARTNLVEEPTVPQPADSSVMLDGVEGFPALAGFVRTHRRPTAETALVTETGEPVLASWRYGLGTVVAFTSDLGGRWSRSWNPWDRAPQLLRQMTRHALRRTSGRADVRLRSEGRTVEATVDVAEGVVVRPGDVQLFGVNERGREVPLEVSLERVGPRRYRATAQAGQPVVVTARVFEDGERRVGEASLTVAATEQMANGPDPRALREMARLGGGASIDEIEELPERGAVKDVPRQRASWPWLLALAGVLVVLDLGLRRLGRPATKWTVPGLIRAAPRTPATETPTWSRPPTEPEGLETALPG